MRAAAESYTLLVKTQNRDVVWQVNSPRLCTSGNINIMNAALRHILQKRTSLSPIQSLCLPGRIARSTSPRLGPNHTTRAFNIRRVVVANQNPKQKKHNTQNEPTGPPIRKKKTGPWQKFEKLIPEVWLGRLPLPPDTYWEPWREHLKGTEAGKLKSAMKFVWNWKDDHRYLYNSNKADIEDGERQVIECTARWELPLIGCRTSVGYGYNPVCTTTAFSRIQSTRC